MKNNIIGYNTAIVFKDNNGNYVHSCVKLNSNGKLRSDSINRIKDKFNVNLDVNKLIYKHTFGSQSSATKAQRIGNAIMKLFYDAGIGSISDLPEYAINLVYTEAERFPNEEMIVKMYKAIYKKFENLVARRYNKNVSGILYVMKDYDLNRQWIL